MEDGKIVDLFFERSEQAIKELSDKYGAVCRKTAENILNNKADSEECVSDAYFAVWNAVPPERPERLLSYLLRIVRNLALKKYHENTALKRNSVYDVALDEIKDVIPSPDLVEDEAAANELSREIDSFLSTLDKKSRMMFVRRYYYSDKLGDIAKEFGKSEHYVSVKLSRVRSSLKKHLEKTGGAK